MATRRPTVPARGPVETLPYRQLVQTVVSLIESGRIAAGRAVNQTITATYWLVGRQIVEHEQHGARRAGYGQQLIIKLSKELMVRFGRGFSERNLEQMRAFYLWKAIPQTPSAELSAPDLPLPWSHYSRLLAVKDESARSYYITSARLFAVDGPSANSTVRSPASASSEPGARRRESKESPSPLTK